MLTRMLSPEAHARRAGDPAGLVDTCAAWDRVIVLANRAPFSHKREPDGKVAAHRSASGLVTALEPVVAACAGTWVALAAGDADRTIVDRRSGVAVPSADPRYRLRYVWLTEHEHRGYYEGFANEALWPLCHAVHVKPVFRSSDFRMYQLANGRFAQAACDEAGDAPALVFVQDYHFALAPRIVRRHLPLGTVVTFWHIPWPDPRVFSICPWGGELLRGLLGSDIVGLQTEEDCANFLDTVDATLMADVDRRHRLITYQGHTTMARPYPVGVAWDNQFVRSAPSIAACREEVCRDLRLAEGVRLGIGVDRLDYTKGLHEKFLAIERLLETHPALRGRFAFVQVAEPSRDRLPAYRATRVQLVETAARVNDRFGAGDYRPIVLLEGHHEPAEVYRLYRAADLCYVGSLHDGMNLVAKEFVAARDDERGVLILSRFAGAARQLDAALAMNPYAVEESAETVLRALDMPDDEQARRMRLLRASVATFDAYWWADQLLRDAMPLGAPSTRSTAAIAAGRMSA